MNIVQTQYDLLQGSRKVVLQHCATMAPADFVQEIDVFAGGSVRNTLVHIASVYESWIGRFALRLTAANTQPGTIPGISETRQLFRRIDSIVAAFLNEYAGKWDQRIVGTLEWSNETFDPTALTLMTHVMTHEFHHKGQLMTMGRLLGYPPPDADIIRFPDE